MYMQVVALASLVALAHAGLLLGDGHGIGLGGGYGGIGLGGGYGGIGIGNGGGYGGGYGGHVVDYYAPPKYEYKYGVEDHHTGDLKEKAEVRVGDVTKTQYAWAEKDRKVQEARVIAHNVPVKIVGHY